VLAQQKAGDEESRDDEKDVDTDEATAQFEEVCVIQHDDTNGDGAQALDVATNFSGHVKCLIAVNDETLVVETGVDPVTFRFSGGRSAD
jgi:hypothetical protein